MDVRPRTGKAGSGQQFVTCAACKASPSLVCAACDPHRYVVCAACNPQQYVVCGNCDYSIVTRKPFTVRRCSIAEWINRAVGLPTAASCEIILPHHCNNI